LVIISSTAPTFDGNLEGFVEELADECLVRREYEARRGGGTHTLKGVKIKSVQFSSENITALSYTCLCRAPW
jgi:hypothetical protein